MSFHFSPRFLQHYLQRHLMKRGISVQKKLYISCFDSVLSNPCVQLLLFICFLWFHFALLRRGGGLLSLQPRSPHLFLSLLGLCVQRKPQAGGRQGSCSRVAIKLPNFSIKKPDGGVVSARSSCRFSRLCGEHGCNKGVKS